MKKDTLYIDIDDTILANCYMGSGMDLRPGVFTQIRILTRLYDCVWLTMWSKDRIAELLKMLLATYVGSRMTYATWDEQHPQRKAGYVLDPSRPQNFWWLEDPLCPEEMQALTEQNKLDRYIRVESNGQWAFLDSVNELFRRSGVTPTDIKRVEGKLEWFDKGAIMAENPTKENLRETLSMLSLIAGGTYAPPEDTLKRIKEYIDNQLVTLF